mgnify:CR=1 FL=1
MEKKERKVIIFVFIGLLIIGLLAVSGFGINVDENTEIDIARMDLKEYVRLFFGESSRLFQYMDRLIGDLMDSVEIDGQVYFESEDAREGAIVPVRIDYAEGCDLYGRVV